MIQLNLVRMAVLSDLKTVSVLCTQRKSVYESFDNVHCFGVKRNAFTFDGSTPVIAHPPCRLWASLKGLAKSEDPDLEKELGRFCVREVVRCGGVLEHPFNSTLFKEMGLPVGGCENDKGFTLEIPQRWFGHQMIKNTWLFFSRIKVENLPPIPIVLRGPCKTISQLSHKQREATPAALAEWLILAALSVE